MSEPTRRHDRAPDRRDDQPADDDRFDFLDLSSPIAAPDLTRAVMGRLGYMPVGEKVARRHRLRRWGQRSGLALAALLALGVATQVHEHSDRARHPQSSTIPSALENDLRHQQRRVNDVIQTIRRIAPQPGLFAPAPAPVDDDEGSPLKDDMARPDNLPTRWV